MENVLKEQINFTSAYKRVPAKGNLVYEYNPFRNYRLNKEFYEYQGHLYNLEELNTRFGITPVYETNTDHTYENIIRWTDSQNSLLKDPPILHRKGELVDFETDELLFDLSHPVDILAKYSYDNSVNLYITDGKNPPRLINSRFSATEKNLYLIVDRKGDNDTNIYDLGALFDLDTSLYKKSNLIPKVTYYGTFPSGNMPIGNYHFYFKYADADGNETDFIAETGLISVFIGTTPINIHSGFRDLNSYKGVLLLLENLDAGYQYIKVYYTRSTSDILENAVTQAFLINLKFLIDSSYNCSLKITGFEDQTEISLTDINLQYTQAEKVLTLAVSLNILFLGNVSKPDINYLELEDISLRLLPTLNKLLYDIKTKISPEYEPLGDYINSYYDSRFIYNKTGYWPDEIYRFGIVYILKDGSLSPVFNTRGCSHLNNDDLYTKFDYFIDDKPEKGRYHISFSEDTYVLKDSGSEVVENSKGVVLLPQENDSDHYIYGIEFKWQDTDNDRGDEVVKGLLQEQGIIGYFIVRLKRIPTTLCLALTIGVDRLSHTPVIPILNDEFISETFITNKRKLDHDYSNRKYTLYPGDVYTGAICPEYDVNYPYFNSLFSGDEFTVIENPILPEKALDTLSYEPRFYYTNTFKLQEKTFFKSRILAIEDNTKLVAIDDKFFSARAGEAEEAFRFEYARYENKTTGATNLIRGSFGPYLGLDASVSKYGKLITIKIPNYDISLLESYFLIRYNDKSAYMAISDRYSVDEIDKNRPVICYRGDCYISLFTHRVNRNFLDPSAPINDEIVDPNTWKDNYKVEDGVPVQEKFDEINLGDVNAVRLGLWVTFPVRSTMNLSIRAIDDSISDEMALTGSPRTFYPHSAASTKGVYKIPEALCYNKGFEKSLSERWNMEVPDVPVIKNDFSNRIIYSEINVNDAFKNNFRSFPAMNRRDYPKTYGSIIKLIELGGDLICVFEHGIARIPVNERVLSGEGSGKNVFVNTSNVLPENPLILSDTFGSLWKDSVIKTAKWIYGVDTIAKKIWRTNGSLFECISDFHILEFLNNNISLTERELTPIIGIRNVKTHYNKFKNDIMFTFYDNLHGFHEKVWNLCFNEVLNKWVTFYSWVPSYSENIYNSFFSFDRNTSKWISKLGVSNSSNGWADGVTLANTNIIEPFNSDNEIEIDKLVLVNRELPKAGNPKVYFTLERDNYKNYLKFEIKYKNVETGSFLDDPSSIATEIKKGNYESYLFVRKGIKYADLCTEQYEREGIDKAFSGEWDIAVNSAVDNTTIVKDDHGRRETIATPEDRHVVYLLNIKAHVVFSVDAKTSTQEALMTGFTNKKSVEAGTYESVVAVIPKWNMQFLTTDFWRHGLAGIIDISDKIAPAYWYGKLHPFEFEFVVADNPQAHKIFDNLLIISNKAEPESFHYEIVGECYDFAKDKKNIYIRQEATKELCLYNGEDIEFDSSYKTLEGIPRSMDTGTEISEKELNSYTGQYDKSTIFPLYYLRDDTINEIEDSYHLYEADTKHFDLMSGAEVVKYTNLDEYRIWNHAPAINICDHDKGRLRGNMLYKEDKWDILINPLNIVLKNETSEEWNLKYKLDKDGNKREKEVPAELNLFKIANKLIPESRTLAENDLICLPPDWERNIVRWDDSDYSTLNSTVKMKDKFMKIRIRYSGEDLAIISAIKTLYSISYA